MLTQGELARIETLENLIQGVLARSNSVVGTAQNRSVVSDATSAPVSPTNSMLLSIAAIACTVKAGGIFLAWINVPWSTGTTGDNIAWTLQTFTGTGALTFTNGTNVANTGNVQYSTAAGGLTIASGAPTGVNANYYGTSQPVLTGMLSGNFSWMGLVSATNGLPGNDAPFAVGNNVVLLLKTSAAHSSTTAYSSPQGNPSMGMLELPGH